MFLALKHLRPARTLSPGRFACQGATVTESEARQLGADAAAGLHAAVHLTAELVDVLLGPVRATVDRLTVRALHMDAETLTRRAARERVQ